MRRLSLVVLSAAALAACDASAPDADVQTPPAAPEPAAPATEGPAWTTSAVGDGRALILSGPRGEEMMRLACLADGRLMASGEVLNEIGSEERLTVGVGGEAYTLVADLEADRAGGVEGYGEIPEDLLSRLEAGGEIGLSYGAQTVGPYPGPEEAETTAFITACRDVI